MSLVTVLGFCANGWADQSLVAFGSSAQEVKKAFIAAGLFQEITTGAATTTLPRPSAFHYSLPFSPSKQPAWVPQEGSRVKGKILAGYLGELSSSTSICPNENISGERKWSLKKKPLREFGHSGTSLFESTGNLYLVILEARNSLYMYSYEQVCVFEYEQLLYGLYFSKKGDCTDCAQIERLFVEQKPSSSLFPRGAFITSLWECLTMGSNYWSVLFLMCLIKNGFQSREHWVFFPSFF